MDSILNTVKMALGIDANYNGFDTNLILDINSAIWNLKQLGIGPTNGFVVKSENDNWSDFLGISTKLESVKTYIFDKVRLSFDPPGNSFLVEAIQKQVQELEWRLMVEVDPPHSLFIEEMILSKLILINVLEEVT